MITLLFQQISPNHIYFPKKAVMRSIALLTLPVFFKIPVWSSWTTLRTVLLNSAVSPSDKVPWLTFPFQTSALHLQALQWVKINKDTSSLMEGAASPLSRMFSSSLICRDTEFNMGEYFKLLINMLLSMENE